MAIKAPLRVTAATLLSLERDLIGFAHTGDGECYFILSGDRAVRVTIVETDVAPKFECFSLALEMLGMPTGPMSPFLLPSVKNVSVLLREEYVEPSDDDHPGLVGAKPRFNQTGAKPGHVPKTAIESCLVAYGLLIEGGSDLLIAADWFPYNIEVTTDSERITALVDDSDRMSISRYIQQHELE